MIVELSLIDFVLVIVGGGLAGAVLMSWRNQRRIISLGNRILVQKGSIKDAIRQLDDISITLDPADQTIEKIGNCKKMLDSVDERLNAVKNAP